MSTDHLALKETQLTPVPLSLVDEVGTVFLSEGRLLRAIRPGAELEFRALLQSGLLEALADRGWIPRWTVSPVSITGYSLVLEQELLPVVSYPYEWSYGMLRDAAARVLEVNELARNYGWELKDCHGYNVVFHAAQPVWVDLGSFVRCDRGVGGWVAYEEFLQFYAYPLWIWSHGGGFIATRLVAASATMTHADYARYRWPLLRSFGAERYQRFMDRWYRSFRMISRISDQRIDEKLPASAGWMLKMLRKNRLLPFQHLSMSKLRAKTLARRRREVPGFWSDYQSQGRAFVATSRFQRIAHLLQEFEVCSVVELGGNQGWLSEHLLERGQVKLAICTDADELAVDRAFERTRRCNGPLHTAVLDFAMPRMTPFGIAPTERFRADAALALAVTHHLLLTQRLPIREALQRIGSYTSRVVFVEFMPLGLWDGTQAPPIPAWYTLEWFRAEFIRQFELLHEELLEENRYLFCGKLRNAA